MSSKITIELAEDGSVDLEYSEGLQCSQIAWMLQVANADCIMQMIDAFKTRSGSIAAVVREKNKDDQKPTS